MEMYEDEASGVIFQAGYDSMEGFQPAKVWLRTRPSHDTSYIANSPPRA